MAENVLIIRKRLYVILVILVALMVFLIIRVGYWNIVKGEWLQSRAQTQRISDSKIMPKRGTIFDRNMNVLAQSAAADTVALVPEQIKKPEEVASALSGILGLEYDSIFEKASTKTRIADDGTEKKIGEVWLKRQISHEQSEAITALELKGVKLVADVKRYYPNKDFASQVIGYTDLDGVGQTGIEKRYNNVLEGRQGRMMAETDARQNDILNGQELFIAPVNGQNVILTIDEVIQSFLEASCKQAVEETSAEAVQGLVIAVGTGEVLAMANLPEFNLNEPPRSDGEALMALSSNIITAKAYEPGSIFTLFTAAAAIDEQKAQQSYDCNGATTVDGEQIMCSAIHGTQTLAEAIENGCSVAASEMASEAGAVSFYSYLSRFGFGEKSGIDFAADTKGDVLAKKYASERDVAKMAVGEKLKVSLMQLANAANSIANGGKLYVPRLVSGLSDENGNITETYGMQVKGQSISEQTATQLIEMLESKAIKTEGGQLGDYTNSILYGASNKYDEKGALVIGKDNSTYIGFAPASDPKYLVLIHLDGVEESAAAPTMAIPYGNKILEDTLKFYLAQPDKAGVVSTTKPSGDSEDNSMLVEVPNVVDMGHQSAKDRLQELGLDFKDNGSGTVEAQDPAAGEMVAPGSVVSLDMDFERKEPTPEQSVVLQNGEVESVTVPDFSGMTLKQARDLAISNGLEFYAHGTGLARSQYPVYGTNVQSGATVTVTFKLEMLD